MEFKQRITRPEAGNKYYITKGAGGFSRAIIGKPTDKWCNVLSNCVGYAAGRFHEICKRTQMDYFDPINAEDIYENAISHGLKVGSEPKLGAAIVWEGVGDKAGHIAIVEDIQDEGNEILTSESGWNCSNPFWTQLRRKGNGNWGADSSYKFKGFIYQPEECEPEPIKEVVVLKEGDSGEEVKELQRRLSDLGYMRKTEIDGDFGKITKGALLCFQLEFNLEVDGVAGPQTLNCLGLKN